MSGVMGEVNEEERRLARERKARRAEKETIVAVMK